MHGYYRKRETGFDRLKVVAGAVLVFAVIIIARLVSLQIVEHEKYTAFAQSQQVTTTIDPATRGKIFVKANKSGDDTLVAENVMLYLLYLDPNPYNDKEFDDRIDREYLAKNLAPILYEHMCGEGALHNKQGETCEDRVNEFSKAIQKEELDSAIEENTDEDAVVEEKPVTKKTTATVAKKPEELLAMIEKALLMKASNREVSFVPLMYTNDPAILEAAKNLNLPGIVAGQGIVYGNPLEVRRDENGNVTSEYQKVAEMFNIPYDSFQLRMSRRLSRYVFLVRRLTPETKEKIDALVNKERSCPQLYANPEKREGLISADEEVCQKLRKTDAGKMVRNFYGIATRVENWRNYPEEDMAAQVVGFLNFEKQGNYGIEEEYDNKLRGYDGQIKIESDPMGRLIASNLKAEQIKDRQDGVDVYLTIDRVVQQNVQEMLQRTVVNTRANSGQAIVMDPYEGKIIAMAQYPTFNPNYYGEAYAMEKTNTDPGKGIPMFIKDERGEYKEVPENQRSSIPVSVEKFVYKNKVGPGSFYNSIVQGTYEPGSIFKPLIMAAGIDSGEITPNTLYRDTGELKVDEFTIRNVSQNCLGTHDMVNVLNFSCNIGMSFIAQQLGKALMYKYIINFGFAERTDVELPGEAKGKVFPYEEWSNARHFNAAFGQGLTVTPLQMAVAYSALANGGILLSPMLVEKVVYHPGSKEVPTQKREGRRVIAKETADTLTAMLTAVAEEGGSKNAKVDGYYIAGKTGTAQIASSSGGYEDGVGSTIGSFAGYLPADKPMFVIITKIDRPRSTQWADQSAAPLFKEIGAFLMKYYNVPAER